MRKLRILIGVIACLANPAMADRLPGTVRALLREFWQHRRPGDLNDLAQRDALSAYIFDRVVEEQMLRRVSVAGLRRDLQLGTPTTTGAATSIVARPGATDLLSAAMESGAIARKGEDTSVTFTVNALPVYQLLSGRVPNGCGSIDEDCRRGVGRWFRGLSGSLSVDPANTTTPVPPGVVFTPGIAAFLRGDRQLSAASLRYELLLRERDVQVAQKSLDAAAAALSQAAGKFLQQQAVFESRLKQLLEASDWTKMTIASLQQNSQSLQRLEQTLLARYRLAYDIVSRTPEIAALHAGVVRERIEYIAAQNQVLADKLYRKALTADYVHQRPAHQPWLHQLRLVAATPLGPKPEPAALLSTEDASPPGAMTLNAGFSFFHSRPERASGGRIRDAQASIAFDWSPRGWGTVRPMYTAAYYFQYMLENGILQFTQDAITPGGVAIPLPKPAIELLNTTGPIHVAQVRVSIPIGMTGISFPLAASYANRTELITGKPFWQGHVGITYDFSKLKNLLLGGTPD